MQVKRYTIPHNGKSVEFTFDNGALEGFLNIEVYRESDALLNLDFHESFTYGEDAVTVVEVENLKIPKQGLIEFLEKTLEMLKEDV